MGVREILLEFLKDVDPAVRDILAEVLVIEQRKIDLERPAGIKAEIRELIDARARAEAAEA